MDVIIVHVVLLLLAAYSHATSAIGFDEWCMEHGKVYSGEQERKARQSVFASNIQLVEKLNQKYNSNGVGFAINHFADLTPQEFRQQILLPPRLVPSELPTHKYHQFHVASDREAPDSLDWRDKGVVSSVKNQGSAGSCWAFSTVGNVEGQWARKTGNVTSLSAEQLVDCDDQNCGAHGGWAYLAYSYIKKVGGISTENDYPYCVGAKKCFPCPPGGHWSWRCRHEHNPLRCNQSQSCSAKLNTNKFVPGLKVKSWITVEKNEEAMRNALFQHGPLSIAINAQQLQFYQHGVWNPPDCDKFDLNHALLLVGYGTEKGVNGRNELYWLIKNSWGVKWGIDGYFKLARGNGICGVDQDVTSAILQ